MDAYLYKAALWCGPCIIKALVAERKAAPGAIDMPPAEALEQIITANGFASESDYDSGDLPKARYPGRGIRRQRERPKLFKIEPRSGRPASPMTLRNVAAASVLSIVCATPVRPARCVI